MNELDLNKLLTEVVFRFSRSGGKGGQNVNKVETKVELTFDIVNSLLLNDELKARLLKKLATGVDGDGVLHVKSQISRTQLGNRKKVVEKFSKLIKNALKKDNIRIKTVRSVSSKLQRLEAKRKHSEKKKERSVRSYDNE